MIQKYLKHLHNITLSKGVNNNWAGMAPTPLK